MKKTKRTSYNEVNKSVTTADAAEIPVLDSSAVMAGEVTQYAEKEFLDNGDRKVTVVIPVYNSEAFISRCINSFICQTLSEIEILVVMDEGTVDNTEEIVKNYIKGFPDKVCLLKKPGKGLSPARKCGLDYARAPYILFIDVDDYVDMSICEITYNKAVENDTDMLGFGFCEYKTPDNLLSGLRKSSMLNSDSINQAIECGGIGWWKFLFNCDFLRKNGHFYDMYWEDAAEIPALLSKCRNYLSIPDALYIKINNDVSMTFSFPTTSKRFNEHTLANEMTLKNVNPVYFRSACIKTARRMIFPFYLFSSYYDYLVDHMKEYQWLYTFDDIKKELTADQLRMVKSIISLPDPMIPPVAIVNDLDGSYSDEYRENAEKTFWNLQEVKKTSDYLSEIRDNEIVLNAYNNKEYGFAADYIVLKLMYEYGGVYISRRVRMRSTFNKNRFDSFFLSFESDKSVSPDVFGAKAGHPLLKKLLDSYETDNEMNRSYMPLSERLLLLLVVEYKLELNGKNQKLKDDVQIYKINTFLCAEPDNDSNISYVDYSGDDNSLSIKKDVFYALVDSYKNAISFYRSYYVPNSEHNSVKSKCDELNKKVTELTAKLNSAKLEADNKNKELQKKNDELQQNYTKAISENNRMRAEYEKKINDMAAKYNSFDVLMDEKEKQLFYKDAEIDTIKTSLTYKVGYVLSYIPRKIYRLISRGGNKERKE